MDMLLDLKGLRCPLPALKARKAMKSVAPGASLTLLATDPATMRDIPALCEAAGFALEQAEEEAGGVFRFRIRQPGGGAA